MNDPGEGRLQIGPAVREHLPGLVEIARHTWEGSDYLDRVAEDWLSRGTLYTGIFQGRVAACGRYTRFPGGVLWLEGLRVHPDFRGRGFGKQMSDHVLSVCEGIIAHGSAQAVEFSTYAMNAESRGLSEKRGFRVAEWFHVLQHQGTPGGTAGLDPFEPCPEDFLIYPVRVCCGWRFAHREGDGFMEWVGRASRAWRTSTGAGFLAGNRGNEVSPLASALKDTDGFFLGLAAFSSARGGAAMNLFLHDSMVDLLAAASGFGWSYWENPGRANLPVYERRR